MSEVLSFDGQRYAIGLYWTGLVGKGKDKDRLTALARRQRATYYCAFRPTTVSAGRESESEMFGLYRGEPPKNGRKQQRMVSLAAAFSMVADPNAIWVEQLEDGRFFAAACRRGLPLLDVVGHAPEVRARIAEVVDQEELASATRYASGSEAESLACVGLQGGALEQPLDGFTSPQPVQALALRPVPRPFPTAIALMAAALVGVGYVAWDWYAAEQAAVQQRSEDPVAVYRSVRDGALAARSLTPLKHLIAGLRGSPAWAQPLQMAGWQVQAISCVPQAGVREVQCTRSWTRQGGTFQGLQAALKSQLQTGSLDSASDVFVVVAESRAASELEVSGTLSAHREMALQWGSWLQRVKDASTVVNGAPAAIPLSGLGEPAAVQAELGQPLLIGAWPQPPVQNDNPAVMYGTPWKVSGGAAWLQEVEQLPAPAFVVTKLDLSGSGSFVAEGVLITRF